MAKYVQINTVCNGSTGKIMHDTQKKAEENGYETISFYGRRKGYKDLRCEKIGNLFSFWWHVFLTTVFDLHGHGSYFSTKKLIKRLREENPDIIHLHNVHGYYLHLPTLFKYLNNEYNGEIRWTFHDCWAFTGHCPHFVLVNCNKWKRQCFKCPNKKRYPISLFFDRSYKNYIEKRNMFSNLKNLKIIVPSMWLEKLVKQSFMKNHDIQIVPNKINETIFKKTNNKKILEKYKIPKNKKIILGVASVWTKEKGLYDFINLSKAIDNSHILVLVGLNKYQIFKMKKYKNIIGIKRTDNQKELAVFYSLASVYVNYSREETFSLTTLEAIKCGCKVLVYNNTPMEEFVNDKYIIDSNKKITFSDILKVEGTISEN